MKKLVILGAGCAGTMVANKLRKKLDKSEWSITIIDKDDQPRFGPFSLLGESKANHWGKMMFKWVYWNKLVSGEEMPLEAQMSLAGKVQD